jgi:hypothetical protein
LFGIEIKLKYLVFPQAKRALEDGEGKMIKFPSLRIVRLKASDKVWAQEVRKAEDDEIFFFSLKSSP